MSYIIFIYLIDYLLNMVLLYRLEGFYFTDYYLYPQTYDYGANHGKNIWAKIVYKIACKIA
jgi:hypothetical protein